jgi:hypothetical protein
LVDLSINHLLQHSRQGLRAGMCAPIDTQTAMETYATPTAKGMKRLWRHCCLMGSWGKGRLPARRRLEVALGREQARALVATLTTNQGLTRRARRVRVKSSP